MGVERQGVVGVKKSWKTAPTLESSIKGNEKSPKGRGEGKVRKNNTF